MEIILPNKGVSIINVCLPQSLFPAIIQWKNPIGFLSREPKAMLTSWLTYKNMSSLEHTMATVHIKLADALTILLRWFEWECPFYSYSISMWLTCVWHSNDVVTMTFGGKCVYSIWLIWICLQTTQWVYIAFWSTRGTPTGLKWQILIFSLSTTHLAQYAKSWSICL